MDEFECYLRNARVLARETIVHYVPFIRAFLTHQFGHRAARLSRLCAGDVVRFVQHQAPSLHWKRAKLLTTALRSFLHYARYRGDTTSDLAAADLTGICDYIDEHDGPERARRVAITVTRVQTPSTGSLSVAARAENQAHASWSYRVCPIWWSTASGAT